MSEPHSPGWLRYAFMRARYLVAAVFLAGVLIVWASHERESRPLGTNIAVKTEGGFVRDGEYPGRPFLGSPSVRLWGSWNGADSNTGIIQFGPFPAPRVLRFWLCGYPRHDGIQIYAEREDTHERAPLMMQSDVGEEWAIVSLGIPEAWSGKPIVLVGRDGATDAGGWVGMSEPIGGGANLALLESLAAFSVNGLLLGVLWFAAARRLEARKLVSSAWTPLLASACVALLGYVALWAYFLGPPAGKIFSVGVFVLGCADVLRKPKVEAALGPDTIASSRLLVLIGVFYLALLHLFPSALDYYALANGRWETMYHDNSLPHVFGQALYLGTTLHWPPEGWLSSDRPPLETGWMLLTWVFTTFLRQDDQSSGGTSGLWFQLTWVFALYGLFRALGMPRRRTCAWVAVLSLCGFFIINSVFSWPKLSAGAFACGVFGLWILPKRDAVTRAGIMIGAALAALALLSHSGVAFSFAALAPWVLARTPSRLATWAKAFLLFLLLMLPWLAYQKFYAPPGNRLLKMHLAGQVDVDPRGTWQTIRENYAKLTWDQIIEIRRSNFSLQLPRDWSWVHDFSAEHARFRRGSEFLVLPRSLTWWIFGFAAFPVVFARWRGRIDLRPHLDLVAWSLAATVIWCLLMFLPTMAIVHQGSYCVPMALFVLLSMWFELASSWAILALLILQGATFLSTWAGAGDQVGGQANTLAVAVAFVAAAAIGLIVLSPDAARVRAE